MNDQVKKTGLEEAIASVAAREAVTEFYFVACGGSNALLMQGQYIIDREAKNITAFSYSSAEFLARAPVRLGKSSVVVTCSHSGNTPETIAATRYARDAGALTIAFTHKPESELDEAAEQSIYYEFDPLTVGEKHNAILLAQLALGSLKELESNGKFDQIKAAIPTLHDKIERVKSAHAEAAKNWAESYKREPVIYTMSSGSCYSIAYSFSICLLQEMQWVNSAVIHSGEYFHGPFEITDSDTPFIVLKTLANSRKMDERALAFADKHSKRILVLDAEEFGVEEVAGDAAEYLVTIMFTALLRTYAVALSDSRGHPLTVRRYMWRMEY